MFIRIFRSMSRKELQNYSKINNRGIVLVNYKIPIYTKYEEMKLVMKKQRKRIMTYRNQLAKCHT